MIYKALDEYSKRDLNPHSHYWPKDFKSFVSGLPFEHPYLYKSISYLILAYQLFLHGLHIGLHQLM